MATYSRDPRAWGRNTPASTRGPSVVRIVTAMNWFGIDAKAFAPDGLDAAMEFIGVPPASRANVLMLVRKLEGMLPKGLPLTAP